ncbi:MAG TPA: hypothetical protein H9815_04850 [Candidatus Ruania gallistercoris]|uniref:Uncharacterized protein n=1 Tax=Candidatus Ruania gallistercoris TaxID=2838746 RepID=A0A9D2EC79_9MICO|nr:hypothetical protein [Candidatus Ruania gallistercoris]
MSEAERGPGMREQIASMWGDWDVTTPRPRRMPQVQLQLGRSVPAWLVRGLAGLLVAVAGVLVASGVMQLVAALVLAVGVAVSRSGVLPGTSVALLLVALVTRLPGEPGLVTVSGHPLVTAALLLVLHAMVFLSQKTTELGAGARIELAALAAGLPAAAAIQGFAQLLGVVVAVAGDAGDGLTWLAVVALVALVALVWTGLRALRRQE